MTPVTLEPAASRSRVKHSTTEPLHSLLGERETCFKMSKVRLSKDLKNVAFSMNFSIFWMELKRRPLSIRQGRKFHKFEHLCDVASGSEITPCNKVD